MTSTEWQLGDSSDQPGWELEIGGIKLSLSEHPIVLGRDPRCDLPLQDERVSWRHLEIELVDGTPQLLDLRSSNGTFLDGRRIDGLPTPVARETILQLGSIRGRLRQVLPAPSHTSRRFRRLPLRAAPIRIGRAPDNDVVLDEPNVSWHHAEVRPGSPPRLVDLGSRNGVRLGARMLSGSAPFGGHMTAGIGPFSIRLQGGDLVVADERGGLSLNAHEVSVQVGERTILRPTTLSVVPGEFVALIGASGSGKTTLLKCLGGIAQPAAGGVSIGTDPIDLRLTEIGYVPQSDVVHARLTVREALMFAARLRLPSDTRKQEYAAAVDDVLSELRLREHQHTPVGALSGGQRKRVACCVELIGKPAMLLLDEPTSGLDPPLERRLMLTLRRLADSGRGIVVVTHATSSLALCDTVAVMGQGGQLLFCGSPGESLEHFQVSAYDEIYNASELVEVPSASTATTPIAPRQPAKLRLLSGRSLVKHTATLSRRYALTFGRDRRTVAVLLGQAPVMALLICLLYPAHLLALPDRQPARSAQFVFLLVTAALWLGLIDSCREIVKERSIVVRELAVGVRLEAHVLAKAGLLFVLASVQCVLLVGVASAIQPLHQASGAYVSLTLLLILTSWSTIGLGLVVSTLARSVDQATSLIPLLLIPQLLFGGALVPFGRMGAGIKGLADLMTSRWAFAGSGHVLHMSARLVGAPQVSSLSGYDPGFFSLTESASYAILLGFTAAMLLTAAVLLGKRQQVA